MQRIYIKILRSTNFQEYKHLALFAALFFLLVLGFVYFTSQSTRYPSIDSALSGSGSLTSCIDMNTVSTEIEITDSAMKRAFIVLSGFDAPVSNEAEAPGECQFKLV